MGKEKLGFKYERKRIKRDRELPPLCADYEPGDTRSCKKANVCKNATYNMPEQAMGSCYGGTKESEIEGRKGKIELEARRKSYLRNMNKEVC